MTISKETVKPRDFSHKKVIHFPFISITEIVGKVKFGVQ